MFLVCLLFSFISLSQANSTPKTVDVNDIPVSHDAYHSLLEQIENLEESEVEDKFTMILALQEKALELAKKLNDPVLISDSYRFLSDLHLDKGQLKRALELQESALAIAKEHYLHEAEFLGYGNLSLIYIESGFLPQSIEAGLKAISLFKAEFSKAKLATIYNNLAIAYEYTGNLESAEQYYTKMYDLAKEENDVAGMILYYINMVDMLMAQENYEQVRYNLDRALELNENRQITELAYIYGLYSELFQTLGDYEEAQKFSAMSIDVVEKVGSEFDKGSVKTLAGRFHFDIGNYDTSYTHFEDALKISINSKFNQIAYEAYHGLSRIDSVKGNFESAYYNFKNYIQYRDEVHGEANAKELQRQEMQAEFDKREALAQAEIRRKKMQRNLSLAGLFVSIVFGGVFLVQRNKIRIERDRSENLLLNILPYETAQELKQKGYADAQTINQVTVLFTDFKGFTQLSETLTPAQLVDAIHECFSAFDIIMEKYGVEKIKTIGDAYMAAGGLPTVNQTHANDVVSAALDIQAYMQEHIATKKAAGLPYFEIRIGVHTGAVVAGIVGIKKFQYDIWGDTVNTASRMESSGEVGKVNISAYTYELICDQFDCEYRGEIEAKGKGKVGMYFVNAKRAS